MEQKNKANKRVNVITSNIHMIFKPQTISQYQFIPSPKEFILSKFKSIVPKNFSQAHPEAEPQPDQQQESGGQQDKNLVPKFPQNRLTYLQKLTMQHVLIGNENQLDLINISNVIGHFVETQHLWSMSISAPINLLAIDIKKFIIVIGNQQKKFLEFYRYNHKKIYKKPTKFYSLSFKKDEMKSIKFFKDCLAIITEKSVVTYNISSADEVIPKSQHEFKGLENSSFNFFTAPDPFETTLNIFFEENHPTKRVFSLWLIQLQYSGKFLKVQPAQKIYDIKKSFKKIITLKNFSKETFLMNLGSEILVFKKGYIVDAASINLRNENSILKYVGDQRLIHLSDRKFQIYEFVLNTKKKPYKIKVQSMDAVDISKPPNSQYFDIIEVFNECFMVVFQIKPEINKAKKGQIEYWFALTQPISLRDKINLIFPTQNLQEISGEELWDKCDTAEKMGMNTKEIYMELWNRSGKSSEADFWLLINTQDYESIQAEIIKKLKKASMSFVKVYKNQCNSLEMLASYALTSKCSFKVLNNYICSHFWRKKLEYFRDLTQFQRSKLDDHPSKMMFGVHDYYELKNLEIPSGLIALINELCVEGKDVVHKIRFLVSFFKFSLRIVYMDLLEEVIRSLKEKVYILFQKVPQILPYTHEGRQAPMYAPLDFYEGVWPQISKVEWEENLSYDRMKNIDNENCLEKLVKDVNFRRNMYVNHGFVPFKKEKIIENQQYMKSDKTFYSVIQWIFQSVSDKNERRKIFAYIQKTYSMMPIHLKGRIILYNEIYNYLEFHNILPKKEGANFTFHQFLQFEDQCLFKHLFLKEKTVKGLILKSIKPIYEEVSNEGLHYFNQNLFNYFKSEYSELSDLKYIFNRINNEKKEFHLKNQEMYEVLVRTMSYKLMVGTENDIPIDEILIYVENIPIDRGNEILTRLTLINDINKNVELLQEAQINMSVEEIINNPHIMISKVIDHLIIREKVQGQTNEEVFEKKSYGILATVQYLYNQIYKDSEETSFFIFFLYLAKIAVDIHAIKFIKLLLADENLRKEFNFDEGIAESLVLYMYKHKFYEDPIYVHHQRYLRSLMTLLPEENEIRQFIICEFEFAKLLSQKPLMIENPLSDLHPSAGLIQLEYFLSKLPTDYILTLEVQQVYFLMDRMVTLNSRICSGLEFMVEDKSDLLSTIFYSSQTRTISRRQIYEEFIIRLLSAQKIRESIPYIEKYLYDDAQNRQYDIVYPLAFLIELENDINEQDKILLKRMAALYFNKPTEFFQIVKQYILQPLSRRQRSDLLREAIKQGQQFSKGFNIESKLLSQQLIKTAHQRGLAHRLLPILQNCYKLLEGQREEFSRIHFNFIFTMLINSPYVLCKYMISSKKFATLKNIRSFITYLANSQIFDKSSVLEFGRRIFLIILNSLINQIPADEAVQNFLQYPLDLDLPESFTPHFDEEVVFFKKLWQTSEFFRREKEKHKVVADTLLADKKIMQEKLLKNPSIIPVQQMGEIQEIMENQSVDEEYVEKKKQARKSLPKEIQASQVVKKLSSSKKRKKGRKDVPSIKVSKQSKKLSEGILKMESRDEYLEGQPSDEEMPEMKIVIKQPKRESMQEKLSPTNLVVNEFIKRSTLSHQNSEEIEEEKKDIEEIDELLKENQKAAQSQKGTQKGGMKKSQSMELSSSDRQYLGKQKSHETEREKVKINEVEEQNLKTIVQKQLYRYFEDFPRVEELGLKFYRTNLINLEKKNRKKYDLKDLKPYENHHLFYPDYLRQIIKYVYRQSTQSPLINIMHMIQHLVSIYPGVGIQRKNFQVFVRADNLHSRYNLELPIRSLFPIEATFDIKADREELFKQMFPTILTLLDDINVYKIAKVVSFSFEINYIQSLIIFEYLNKLIEQSANIVEHSQLKQFEEKAEVLIQSINPDILSERFIDLYVKVVNSEFQTSLTKRVIEKVKKKGSKQQKIKLLKDLLPYEPQYQGMLDALMKR